MGSWVGFRSQMRLPFGWMMHRGLLAFLAYRTVAQVPERRISCAVAGVASMTVASTTIRWLRSKGGRIGWMISPVKAPYLPAGKHSIWQLHSAA